MDLKTKLINKKMKKKKLKMILIKKKLNIKVK